MVKLIGRFVSLFSVLASLDACMMDDGYRKPGVICLEMQNLNLIALNPNPKWKSISSRFADSFTSSKTIVAPEKSRVVLALQNLTWSPMDNYVYEAGKCLHGKLRVYVDPKNNESSYVELCNQEAPIFVSKGNQLKMEEVVVRYSSEGLHYVPYYTVVTPVEESTGPYASRPVYKLTVRQAARGMISQIPALYEKGAVLTWELSPPKLTDYAMCTVNIIQPCASSSDVLKIKYSGRPVENGTTFEGGDDEPVALPRDVMIDTVSPPKNLAYRYLHNDRESFADSRRIRHEKMNQKRLLIGESLQFFYEMNGDVASKWSVSWECHVYANKDLDELDADTFKPVYLTEDPDAIRKIEYGCRK